MDNNLQDRQSKFVFKLNMFIAIAISMMLALMLMLLPLPASLSWLNPDWMVLIFLYWVMVMQAPTGMLLSIIIGLFLDVCYKLPLGSSAMGLILITYIVNKFFMRIYLFSFWQKLFLMSCFLLLYRIYMYLLFAIFNQVENFWIFIFPAVIGILIWPSLSILLHHYQKLLKG
jgi:rod shape-determining protein MreD